MIVSLGHIVLSVIAFSYMATDGPRIIGSPAFQERMETTAQEFVKAPQLLSWLETMWRLRVVVVEAPDCPGAMCAYHIRTDHGESFTLGVTPSIEYSTALGASMFIHELQHFRDQKRGCTQEPWFHYRAWKAMQDTAHLLDLSWSDRNFIGAYTQRYERLVAQVGTSPC